MTAIVKKNYQAPVADVFFLTIPPCLLVSLSVEGGIDDWEEGGEL